MKFQRNLSSRNFHETLPTSTRGNFFTNMVHFKFPENFSRSALQLHNFKVQLRALIQNRFTYHCLPWMRIVRGKNYPSTTLSQALSNEVSQSVTTISKFLIKTFQLNYFLEFFSNFDPFTNNNSPRPPPPVDESEGSSETSSKKGCLSNLANYSSRSRADPESWTRFRSESDPQTSLQFTPLQSHANLYPLLCMLPSTRLIWKSQSKWKVFKFKKGRLQSEQFPLSGTCCVLGAPQKEETFRYISKFFDASPWRLG